MAEGVAGPEAEGIGSGMESRLILRLSLETESTAKVAGPGVAERDLVLAS